MPSLATLVLWIGLACLKLQNPLNHVRGSWKIRPNLKLVDLVIPTSKIFQRSTPSFVRTSLSFLRAWNPLKVVLLDSQEPWEHNGGLKTFDPRRFGLICVLSVQLQREWESVNPRVRERRESMGGWEKSKDVCVCGPHTKTSPKNQKKLTLGSNWSLTNFTTKP